MAKKILIIEDDPDILEMMAYILRDEGYEVITALDCAPFNAISTINPDLILLDNRLGADSGGDICKGLKTAAATAHIPVVLVSANMHLENMAADSMANGYLSKPFDIEELVAIVNKHLL